MVFSLSWPIIPVWIANFVALLHGEALAPREDGL